MKPEIKISGVLALLEQGKSREEIAEHYGITMADCKRLFENPKLKGKKAKKQPAFTLIDDLEDNVSNPDTEEDDEIGGDFTDVNAQPQELGGAIALPQGNGSEWEN